MVELVTNTTAAGHLRVSLIRTPPVLRGKGLARQAMAELIAEADRQGVTIVLTPEPLAGDRSTSRRRLEGWYRSLGFVRNAGRNRDFKISDSWYRRPAATRGKGKKGNADVVSRHVPEARSGNRA